MAAGSAFHVAAETSLQGVLEFLSLLVVSLAVLEFILSKIEKKAKGRKVYSEMLAKVYRELMILGMVSFSSVVAAEIGLDKSSAAFLEFESAHIMIFFTALLLTLQAICIYFTLRYINMIDEWLEEMDYSSEAIHEFRNRDGRRRQLIIFLLRDKEDRNLTS